MPKPRHDVMSILSQWEPDRDKGTVGNVASLMDFAARRSQALPSPGPSLPNASSAGRCRTLTPKASRT